MNNPGFQEYFIPVLEQLKMGKSIERKILIELVADAQKLSTEIKSERLPSQTQPTYANRIGWAMTYLSKAGLILSPSRGLWQITDEGKRLLSSPPSIFNVTYLKKNYTDFQTFHQPNPNNNQIKLKVDQEDLSPDELLLQTYEEIKQPVCDEILERVINNSPDFFERLVIDLLLNMGYGNDRSNAGKKLGRSGDEGIDGTINQDKLGLDTIYIQAKRWKRGNNVGRRDLQQFVGALSGQNASKGVFLTTSDFTLEARSYRPKNDMKLILISGEQLASLLFEFGVGVTKVVSYEIKKIDSDYFEE
jgi:restriction system protein